MSIISSMNEIRTGKNYIKTDFTADISTNHIILMMMMMKNACLISLAPSLEPRRATFPGKIPPPAPSAKPHLPVTLKEAKAW